MLRKIYDGEITEADLTDALFHFGCMRKHAMNFNRKDHSGTQWANEARWLFPDEPAKVQRARWMIIVNAVKKAEAEGRIVWRSKKCPQTFSGLSTLLAKNGFPDVIGGDDGKHRDDQYHNNGAENRITKARLEIEVC